MGTDNGQLFENYITVKKFAELVGRKPRTIREWCKAGKVPFIRLEGGSIIFKVSSVDEWLASQEVKNVKRRRR